MEPSSGSVAAGITISVGTVSIVGTLFGMHYDALLFGLLGGLVFLSRSETVARTQAVTSMIASCLIAGLFSPIAASLIVSINSSLGDLGPDTLRRASALALGGGWQAALPAALEGLSKWLRKDR